MKTIFFGGNINNKMRKCFFLSFAICLLLIKCDNADAVLTISDEYGFISSNGYIPDKETAIKIAKAIWQPIYGKRELFLLSYDVKLENESVWVIEGYSNLQIFFNKFGGGPIIKIDKFSGRVLYVGHTG
jgi:hypothetical protein